MIQSHEREELKDIICDLVRAIEAITYPAWHGAVEIYIGRHGDSDCTEDIKPALDRAKKALGL